MIAPEGVKSKEFLGPPPYPQPSETTPLHTQPQAQYGEQQTYTKPEPVVVYHTSPKRRFFRAFIVAAGVLVLMQTFINLVNRPDSDYDFPSDITLDYCSDEWEEVGLQARISNASLPTMEGSRTDDLKHDFPFRSKVSFELPLDSNVLSIIARGPNSGGNLDIVTDPEQAKDTVKYSIVFSYYRKKILDEARVCVFSREGDERGVGIFTPYQDQPRKWKDRMFVETTITIPEEAGVHGRTTVKKLTTDVPNTVHRTSHLAEKVLFDSIDLRGTNGPILVFSLEATTGELHATNGIVRGTYTSPGPLSITSTNGPISISVELDAKHDGTPSELLLQTSNGEIKSAFSLLNSGNVEAPSYSITGNTSNGPISVSFPTAPVASTLELDLHTSNSPAEVKLHPTFEGHLYAATSRYTTAKINVDNSVEDPSGRGRKREVTLRGSNGREVEGEVYWAGDSKKAKGDVSVGTSNSPVVITL